MKAPEKLQASTERRAMVAPSGPSVMHAWRSSGVTDALRMSLILMALVAAFGFSTDSFFSTRTFAAITSQVPALLVAAVGTTFVMVAGQIDLSIGSVLGLCGAVLGVTMTLLRLPLSLAIPATMILGASLGTLSSAVMVRWRLPSFIVTLGMLEVARGATYIVTDSRTHYIGASVEVIADAKLFGVSLPFVLAMSLVALAQAVLTRTVFGRYLVAVGTNEEAVRLSGIRTHRLRVAAFCVAGGLTGLAAVLHTSRLGASDPNAGIGFELQAIAAVVIGGTSLSGGRGTMFGTLFGVLIIALLDTGLAQVGAAEPAKRIITGLVIVVAVVLDNVRHGKLRG